MNRFKNFKLYVMMFLALCFVAVIALFKSNHTEVMLLLLFLLIFVSILVMSVITSKIKPKDCLKLFKNLFKAKRNYIVFLNYILKIVILLIAIIGIYYLYDFAVDVFDKMVLLNYGDTDPDKIGFITAISILASTFFRILIIFVMVLVINYIVIKTVSMLYHKYSIYKETRSFPIYITTYLLFTTLITISIYVLFYIDNNFDSAHAFYESTINVLNYLAIFSFITIYLCMIYIIVMQRGDGDLKLYKYILVGVYILVILIPYVFVSNLNPRNEFLKYDDAQAYASALYESSTNNDVQLTSNLMYSIFSEEMQLEVADELDVIEIEDSTLKIDPIYNYILRFETEKPTNVYITKEDDNVYTYKTDTRNLLISAMISTEYTSVYELSYESNIAKYLTANNEPVDWYGETSRITCVFETRDKCNDAISLPISRVEVYDRNTGEYTKEYVASNDVMMQEIIKQLAVFDVYFNTSNAQPSSLKLVASKDEALNYINDHKFMYIHQAQIEAGYSYTKDDFEDDLAIPRGQFDVLMQNIYGPKNSVNYEFLADNYDEYYDLFRMIQVSIEQYNK